MRHQVVIYAVVVVVIPVASSSSPSPFLSLSPRYLTFFQAEKIMSRVPTRLRLTQVKAKTSIVASEAATRKGSVWQARTASRERGRTGGRENREKCRCDGVAQDTPKRPRDGPFPRRATSVAVSSPPFVFHNVRAPGANLRNQFSDTSTAMYVASNWRHNIVTSR